MPLQPRLSFARVARLSLLAAGLGALLMSLSAQAQVSAAGAVVNAAVLQGAAQNAMAADPAQGAALMAPQGMATPGTTGLPTLPQRPDMGAADAPRTPLTPLRQPKVEAPSQFQRFVQEGTGKLLPLFGANLFDNPQAYSAVSTAAPAPGEYVIGPGDEVRVSISGAVEHSTTQTVDRNGQITLPKVGTVNLGGVQVKDLEAALRKQVGTVFTNVAVNGSLGKLRGVTVYVVGQARQPGTYNLTSLSTLVNAVFASGGPGANGSMRNITLRRGGKTVTTLDLYDFIAKGDKGQDAALQPGDVIMIPPAGPRVALTGATDHGAIYELKNGTTVQDVLALGGGVPALASAQKALVERIDPQQPRAPRQVQNLVLDAQGLAQALRDGDVITLLPISPAFANAVTLQGTVAQPLRHAFTPGMRVQDLIPDREALITPDYYRRKNQLVQNRTASLKAQGLTSAQIQAIEKAQQLPDDPALATEIIAPASNAGATVNDRVRGLVDQINWDYAVIERLNKAELRTELIPFNLGKAVIGKDPQHNLELQAGDVVLTLRINVPPWSETKSVPFPLTVAKAIA